MLVSPGSNALTLKDVILYSLKVAKERDKGLTLSALSKIPVVLELEGLLKGVKIIANNFGPTAVQVPKVIEELEKKGLVEVRKKERDTRFGYPYMRIVELKRDVEVELPDEVKRRIERLVELYLKNSGEFYRYVYRLSMEREPKLLEKSNLLEVVPKGTEFEYKGKRYKVTQDVDYFVLYGYLRLGED